MKKYRIFITVFLTLELSSSYIYADLVSVDVISGPHQHPDGNYNTWQVIAVFNNALDRISSVNGLEEDGLNTLDFWTASGELYNQALFGGNPLNDFPSDGIGGEAWDSYVTIGDTSFPTNISFTPNFLGDWDEQPPPVQVIEGSEFHESDGAWYFFGAPPMVSDLEDAVQGNDTFDVVIAQFTMLSNGFHLNGNVAWLNPASGGNNTPFEISFPSPGALALFGIAGLCGIRRRRE